MPRVNKKLHVSNLTNSPLTNFCHLLPSLTPQIFPPPSPQITQLQPRLKAQDL